MRLPATLPAFVLATGLLALAGCSCPKSEPPPPQFMLAFSPDTLAGNGAGFRRAEVRSAYLIRYADAAFQSSLDTLRQPTPASVKSTKTVFGVSYGGGHPSQFTLPTFISQNVNARSFRLVVPAATRTYDITNVVLEQKDGSGRCSVPHVVRNEATVNGQLRSAVGQIPQLTK